MNQRLFIYLAMLFEVCIAIPTSAQVENPFQGVTTWGKWLFDYDAACWVATDTVKATHPDSSKLGVYVAVQVGARWLVAFGRIDSSHFQMSFAVTLDSTDHVIAFASYSPCLVAPDFLLRAARAFETGLRAFGFRSRPYNPMVFPQSNSTWTVYLVPAETSTDSVYIGGDARYTLSSDGLSVLDTTKLHESLIVTAKPSASEKEAMLIHSHVLIPMPVETDVFYVLRQHPRMPHYIAAGNRAYAIDPDGEVRLLDANLAK